MFFVSKMDNSLSNVPMSNLCQSILKIRAIQPAVSSGCFFPHGQSFFGRPQVLVGWFGIVPQTNRLSCVRGPSSSSTWGYASWFLLEIRGDNVKNGVRRTPAPTIQLSCIVIVEIRAKVLLPSFHNVLRGSFKTNFQ